MSASVHGNHTYWGKPICWYQPKQTDSNSPLTASLTIKLMQSTLRWPATADGSRAEFTARRFSLCARHLEQAEATLLTEMYDRAIANVDCPGCGRVAGRSCSQQARDLRTLDGRWSSLKAFNSR
jgi:hypothetical protein